MGEGLSSREAMGIDVDAVRNESQNSLSVQFGKKKFQHIPLPIGRELTQSTRPWAS
jgi:hypothetical protein